jgi:sulfatase modifying factor 1
MGPFLAASLAALALTFAAHAAPRSTTSTDGLPVIGIPRGIYRPQYPPARGVTRIEVPAFVLMTRPVTNREYLAFVSTHPAYQRGRIAALFADEHYLTHWAGPTELGEAARPDQPVTRISWFAAKAFCESHGMRLPREAEWEMVAAASTTQREGSKDAAFQKQVFRWYSTPNSELPDVPHGSANFYGVFDLHGVVWEWVEDFNNAVVIADSREQGDETRNRFCGGNALNAANALDYATFMRLAMRGSLEARYTTSNLGFRCAADASASDPPNRSRR